ncbi:SDR family NAD(P)-dependent oxidoreductase [Bradyrhizobium sp. LHD-71]|uniref:SDR family NAD(P)-dependent oxidoreductase n=1 Tax=Bradyrhizobium sp. LHD-71 TaxID=3072141 RepID=UPI00280DE5C1|nr:SDR family NAD(P)-dependent oxidoreductase [Bradyrhizobium sp. LHD-71]MDQ8728048.1 SDR family NAD(P)-dependent oxidoreductase [Bradyrhizobium sp. LHD-71]
MPRRGNHVGLLAARNWSYLAMTQRILILGATSAIAHAYARLKAKEGAAFVLAGRRTDMLEANAADLMARGASSTALVAADLADLSAVEATMAACRAHSATFDEVLLAYGMLGDQARAEADLTQARTLIDVNFTSAALWLLALVKEAALTPLTIVVVGSVAGDRGRKTNFIYGAAKGGLERFVEGMQHAHASGRVRIVLIKPGFVITPMTDGIANQGGPLWATAEAVAGDIVKAARSGRPCVYTPWFWWGIMTTVRNLPRAVFNRLNI